jgi:hypothetical protein
MEINNNKESEMVNPHWNNKNNLARIGYKTFRGLVGMLKRINDSCIKKRYK